jgi:hypothetical protein
MKTSHPYYEIIHQVQHTNYVFPLIDHERFGNVLMKSYAVKKDELNELVANLEEQFSLQTAIESVSDCLVSNGILPDKRLLDYIQNLESIFSGYAKEGTHSSRYFAPILSSLHVFRRHVQLQARRDKDILVYETLNADIEKIEAYIDGRSKYTEQLHKYYDIFNDYLQQEADKKQGLQVITRSEQYLMNLTGMIGQLINSSQSILKSLEKLRGDLTGIEQQILFN